MFTKDPDPELLFEPLEPLPPALTGASVLTNDPFPELSLALPVPLPASTGALVLISDP